MKLLSFAILLVVLQQPPNPLARKVNELEYRVGHLEKVIETCCTQSHKPFGIDKDLEWVVRMNSRIRKIEVELGMRKSNEERH